MCSFVASTWAWHKGPVRLRAGLDGDVGVSLSRVSFKLCQVLLWAWHGVKGEAIVVNKAERTTGIVWKVWREERLRICDVGVTC